jgi:uncharacterized membrane protein
MKLIGFWRQLRIMLEQHPDLLLAIIAGLISGLIVTFIKAVVG